MFDYLNRELSPRQIFFGETGNTDSHKHTPKTKVPKLTIQNQTRNKPGREIPTSSKVLSFKRSQIYLPKQAKNGNNFVSKSSR